MRHCMVPFCPNRGTVSGVCYFRITSTRHKSWMIALKRNPEDSVHKDASICSQHFLPNDFVTVNNKKTLKVGAVPQINLRPLAKRNLFLYSDKFSVKFVEIPETPIFSNLTTEALVDPLKIDIDSKPDIVQDFVVNHSALKTDSEELESITTKLRKLVHLDHNYCLSSRKLSRLLKKSNQSVLKLQMKLKNKEKTVARLQRKLKHFADITKS